MAPNNTDFPERELCRCKGRCKISPVFGWLQLNCFMNKQSWTQQQRSRYGKSFRSSGRLNFSVRGRQKKDREGETSTGTFRQNSCHKRLFHPCPEGSVFTGQREVRFPSPNYKAAGASDTSFKDEYTPRGWSDSYLLHGCFSRSVCFTDAAVQGVRWNKEWYLYHWCCNDSALPFVPVTLMMSSAMGALAKEKKWDTSD